MTENIHSRTRRSSDVRPIDHSGDDAAERSATSDPQLPTLPAAEPPLLRAADVPDLNRLLVESIQDYAIIRLDTAGHILSWNAGAQRVKGYRADEIIGRHFSVFFTPEDIAAAKPARELEIAATFGRLEDEGWRVRKDGTRFWADVTVTALRTPDGRLAGFAKITRDATDRRAAEEALRISEERFRLLVQNVKDYAIFMLDPEGHVTTWNEGAQRIKGYRAGEIIGKHFSTFYTPQDVASGHPQEELEIAAREGSYEEEGWRVRKDGTLFWANVVITAIRNSHGTLIGFAKVTRDLTDRRARAEAEAMQRATAIREEELRRANEELAARAHEERALRTLAQAIARATDATDVMRQIADGALGVSDAAGAYVERVATGGGEVEIVATAGDPTPVAGQRVAYPGSLSEEILARREPVFLARLEGLGAAMAPYLDETCHGCSVLVVPLLGRDAPLGALVLIRRPNEPPFEHGVVNRVRTLGDIASIALQRLAALAESERRREEAEAAVRSRDEVLSIVSHDLRNPVSTVAMSVALLQDREILLDDKQRETQLAVIARSAARMDRLIRDLLDVAVIESGRLTISGRDEDPGALLTEVFDAFRPLAAEKEVTLDLQVTPGLRTVRADRDRIVQALSNYMNNAVKFTPPGGRIVLRASPEPEGGVRFTVSDTGPGIPAEELPHVFDRFWQAKRTAHLGSGLGLAIAKGIADAHRGRSWAESTPGEGSSFHLTVP